MFSKIIPGFVFKYFVESLMTIVILGMTVDWVTFIGVLTCFVGVVRPIDSQEENEVNGQERTEDIQDPNSMGRKTNQTSKQRSN